MPVTDYTLPIDKLLPWGEIATLDNAQIWAFKQSTAVIYPFGFGVVKGATDGTVKLPSAKTDLFYGIVRAADIYEKRAGYSVSSQGYDGFPAKEVLSVIRGGSPGTPISVPISQTVADGDPVFLQVLDNTVNTAGIAGTWRKDSDGTSPSDRAILITYARWIGMKQAPGANTLGTGYLELRMPN
jgi:hypothetical protein